MIHKTTRSILSVLLAALLLVTSTPLTPAFAGVGEAVSLQSESGEGGELAGAGTEVDPYKIATADDLLEFAKLVNDDGETTANAILTADIDLSDKSWIPIGSINQYRGTFDGDGHTISGLYIDSNDYYQGLFGYLSTDGDNTGTVQNLTVSGSVSGGMYVGGIAGNNRGSVTGCAFSGSVSGNSYVGGVVGENSGSVTNCAFSGSVTSSSSYVGGVVGENSDGSTVENCYNTGTVTGTDDYVGGVVGENRGISIVKNCYNTGAVSGGEDVGGVVGNNSSSSTVENCYNTGTVTGPSTNVGGVVGDNRGPVKNCYNTGNISGNVSGGVVGQNHGSVTNCYNIGTVSGGEDVGGVVGYNFDSVTGCYFLQQELEISGIGDGSGSGSATPLSAEKFESQESFTSWDFASTWKIEPIFGRPTLQDNAEIGGTANNPYKIFTATQLKNFRDLVNDENGNPAAWAVLMNNIDLSSVCGAELSNGQPVSWTPIGSIINSYEGTFDGNGKTIENLYINKLSSDYQGLFGRVNGGTVKDLTVSGTVSGNYNVGGVVGYNNGGTVTGCIFSGSGSVSGKNYVGGVVGYNDGGTVTGCIFSGSGSVSGEWYVGGIAGQNNGTVENCYNTGSVNGSADSSDVGGVVGLNRGTVENCYNTDSVSGKNYVGGVVGYNNGGSVTNSYNTDSVKGYWCVGGVVGYNVDFDGYSASVENCYNTGSVSDGTYTGGVVGYNFDSGIVANCYFLQTADVNKDLPGIGEGSGDAAAKDDTAFHSGEVAWRLQNGQTDGSSQVWGQSNLTATTSLPTLVALDKANAQKVYQVTFDYGTSFADNDGRYAYSYTNGVVSEPTKNPELAGHTLSGWYSDPSLTTAWTFDTEISNDKTLYAKWTPVAEPEPTPTPTPDPTPSGPSTGDSSGWDDILDELENTAKGDEITIDMGDETKVPAEIFESVAGKDVDVTFDLGDDLSWTVNGKDIPDDAALADLDLGVALDTDGIPVNVINTITGEVGTVQITLAHDGEFGFTMTLTAPLGKENAGYWANLYHYDEDAEAMNFEAAAKIDEDGSVKIPFSHASQYAIVIDTHSHATVDVSDLFIDIAPDAWYKDAIQYAYDNGLMTGTSANEFAPEQTTTRAMIVSILARLEGVTTAEAAGFADVDDNDWYATAVNWAANVGVVNGYEDNTFRPNQPITREQLAAILMNYAACIGEDVSNRADLSAYSDTATISSWANDVMQWAVAEGLISGVTNDQLQPQSSATRAQVAAILQRLLEA